MSKETEPTPSRRQLREAMSAQADAVAPAVEEPQEFDPARPEAVGIADTPSRAPNNALAATAAEAAPETDAQAAPAPESAAPDAASGVRRGRRTQTPVEAKTPPLPTAAKDVLIPAPPAGAPASSTGPVPRERSSQTRARDRAALRAYKELVDGVTPAAEALPSRRALRQAQLDAERAPITSINPVVSPATVTTAAVEAALPAEVDPSSSALQQQAMHTDSVEEPTKTSVEADPGESADGDLAVQSLTQTSEKPSETRPEPKTSEAVPETLVETLPETLTGTLTGTLAETEPETTGRVGSAAATLITAVSVLPAKPATSPSSYPKAQESQAPSDNHAEQSGPTETVQDPAGGRRLGRRAAGPLAPDEATMGTEVPKSSAPRALEDSERPAIDADVPEVAAEPETKTTGVPQVQSQAPSEEELRELAAQRAVAERNAILEQRAQTRERLLAENAKSRKTPQDPTATNNLAMVTPLEFIDVPGMDRPVLRPPSTTHVPIVTSSRPNVPMPSRSGTGISDAARFDAALSARDKSAAAVITTPVPARSSTLQRAEQLATVSAAMATDTLTRTQMPPMPADYAHGLEPLDAVTAGLGRSQRSLLIQWGSLIIGGAAFVVGAVMLISALAR